jgi:Protein of unknown function (DUF3311)
MQNGTSSGRRGRQWAYILLLIPIIATLWVPFYETQNPSFYGIPYFYWYMFLWVIITAILTAIVYAIVG